MKVAVIADTHFGVRGDDPYLRSNQIAFMEGTFLPWLRETGIKRVIHLGDLFDRRKYVNYVTAKACWDSLVHPLIQMGVDTDYIVGNHDCYYRDTNELNSINTLYGEHVRVIASPTVIDLGGRNTALVPWICEGTQEASDAILAARPEIVMGHLALTGFKMDGGQVCSGGTDPSTMASSSLVLSGHFHTRSRQGNIHYIGATEQYTWADYGEDRGFVIINTDTLDVEYVNNPLAAFTKIVYDDTEGEEEVMSKIISHRVKGQYVKLMVRSKNDPFLLERVIDKVEASGVVDLQVIDGTGNDTEFDPSSVHIVDETDTLKVLTEMVVDEQSKDIIKELYVKAQMRL